MALIDSRRLVEGLTLRKGGTSRGHLMQFARMPGSMAAMTSTERRQRQLAQELLDQDDPKPVKIHDLPWEKRPPVRAGDRGPLSPAAMLWLSRLPLDPKAIPDADVAELARLHASTKPFTDDRRLIDSIYGPVKAHHIRLHAESQLAAAKAEQPYKLPANALDVLAATIREERTDLRSLPDDAAHGAALSLAREMLDGAVAARDREMATRVERAERQLADPDLDAAGDDAGDDQGAA